MDVELLMHGVPVGQDYYGIAEEQANMGLFYDNSTESVKFVVETKQQGSRPYAYYSYLRYKGIIGSGGRPGSYFGLTLRIDKYYSDAIHIYNLLDILFKKYIVGILLTPSGGGYKYLVSNYASKTANIEKIQQELLQLIPMTCVSAKFMDISASFIHPITSVPNFNITDVSESTILELIRKHSKVVLSPDYETNAEKDYKKKIHDAENNAGNIASQKDKTINSLNATISSQQNKISSLERDNKTKDAEIQQLKKGGDVSQLVAKIKEPINTLAEYFRVKSPQPPFRSKPESPKIRFNMINCFLSLIILVICVIGLFRLPKPYSDRDLDYKKEYVKLPGENRQTKDMNRTNNNFESSIPAPPDNSIDTGNKCEDQTIHTKKDNNSNTSKTLSKPSIAISPNVKEVVLGEEYTFSIMGYTGKGEWKVDGFSSPRDKHAQKIKVKVIKNGNGNKTATISYTPEKDGYGKVTSEYKIKNKTI